MQKPLSEQYSCANTLTQGRLYTDKCLFPRTSSRRVLLKVEVCYTSSHPHMFACSRLLISAIRTFTSSHLLTFTYSHLRIFSVSSSHLHISSQIFTNLHISSHIFIYLHISSYIFSLSLSLSLPVSLSLSHSLSPHSSPSHLHIFTSSYLYILTFSHLQIFSFSLSLSLFCPLSRSLSFFFFSLLRPQAVPMRRDDMAPFRTKRGSSVKH